MARRRLGARGKRGKKIRRAGEGGPKAKGKEAQAERKISKNSTGGFNTGWKGRSARSHSKPGHSPPRSAPHQCILKVRATALQNQVVSISAPCHDLKASIRHGQKEASAQTEAAWNDSTDVCEPNRNLNARLENGVECVAPRIGVMNQLRIRKQQCAGPRAPAKAVVASLQRE
jgi:hypothetical protein